ncbi:MAG TPA: glycosyl hydrolase [Thermoanaerobaculia bacterium]|nr:glycosyl hydrolase [Thermoanaerobaculia bacterium]
MKRIPVLGLCLLLLAGGAFAEEAKKAEGKKADGKKTEKKAEEKKGGMTAGTFAGLELRGIGPALTSGRIIDIAVDPEKSSTWYVAVASGGVWKTTNAGNTFTPVFDGQPVFSIGCVTVDPNNPLVVWVGSGENNSQRSVSYGDGVYKSVDGGKSWENVGLKKSEHIAKILVDPRDSNTVYVASQGPLWAPGGDRGLYKTTDGGKTWNAVLTISENTGVTDVVMDPRNPDTLYAAAYQRRRHVWTLINGGPEAGIHKSTDGGKTWKKLTAGLPKEDMGRIGLAIAPSQPDRVYAIVEALGRSNGFYRSDDAGASWAKVNDYVSNSPQYYQEIFVDPEDADRIYSMDVLVMISENGGKDWSPLGEKSKHVDNHALWIDPADRDHLLVGCDGGLYESWDRGENWDFKPNLPVTQFYRVSVDNATPFYNVYGGTQDNFSLGGPSRTNTDNGVVNSDWFVTQGGDGFETQVDPEDSNIIYAQSQHGGLVRFDRKSGEQVDVQPRGSRGEALRFNWDSPLLISPHNHLRLYHAANRLFRSDDRGNTWKAISPDLTRQIDRRKLKVMGKVWGADTVAYNNSTSFYGNIVSLSESPAKADILYVGTDDGLVQVSGDGGANWTKVDKFPGVPENTYVSNLAASRHSADTVYAAFNNHKQGDFKPYLLKSTDRGKTWTSIVGDLPDNQPVWALAEDHVNPNLLFVGTEFGLYFTIDGGKKWIQLKSLPVIPVRDLDIQRRENDLAVATFGRGFYILDDYTLLRTLKPEVLDGESALFPVKKTVGYIEASPLGGDGKSFQGESFYNAPNPPFGAIFTYFLKDELKSRRKQRQEADKNVEKEGGTLVYPAWDVLRAEDRERDPQILFTVTDEEGHVVRRITAPGNRTGLRRIAWDLRYPASTPVRAQGGGEANPFFTPPRGPLAAPGTYKVQMAKLIDGVVTNLGEPQTFEVTPLNRATLPAKDWPAALDFQRKTARLQRAVLGAVQASNEAQTRINAIQRALLDTPAADPKLNEQARTLELRLKDIQEKLSGDPVLARANEPTPPSIVGQVQGIVFGQWGSTSDVTGGAQDDYNGAAEAFAPVLADLRKLMGEDLKALEDQVEAAGGPWTPGRLPSWNPE